MTTLPNLFAPPSVSATLTDTYIQPNLNYALRVWWAFYWPTTLISTILTILVNIALKQLYENTAFPAYIIRYALILAPYLLVYATAIFIFRYILAKTFRHFRIALRTTDPNSTQTLPVTFSRTLRVWWRYTWRALVYAALGIAFIIYPMTWFANMFRPDPAIARSVFFFFGLLLNAAFALFIFYSNILDEEIADFRVALLPHPSPATPLPAPAAPLPASPDSSLAQLP
jgi:hypothetical protein